MCIQRWVYMRSDLHKHLVLWWWWPPTSLTALSRQSRTLHNWTVDIFITTWMAGVFIRGCHSWLQVCVVATGCERWQWCQISLYNTSCGKNTERVPQFLALPSCQYLFIHGLFGGLSSVCWQLYSSIVIID